MGFPKCPILLVDPAVAASAVGAGKRRLPEPVRRLSLSHNFITAPEEDI
jgi:hypothetical protein